MTETSSPAEASEAARKLFSGPCTFVWGSKDADTLPSPRLSEVAFLGRSNVGKSSLINALTGRKTLARVSQTPGATRQLNFFNLADRLMLVDLPGYGFAKRSKAESQAWQEAIFSYLRRRARLKRLVLLLDTRRGLGQSDIQVMELLDRTAVSYLLVLTKADTLTPQACGAAKTAAIDETARHGAALAEVLVTSARDGQGIAQLRTHLAALI